MTFGDGSYCEARVQNEADTAGLYRLRETPDRRPWVDLFGRLEPGEPVLVVHGQLAGTREIYYVLTAKGLAWMSAEHLSKTVSIHIDGRVIVLKPY